MHVTNISIYDLSHIIISALNRKFVKLIALAFVHIYNVTGFSKNLIYS